MEFLRNHRYPVAAVLAATGALAFAGCGVNTEGAGNDFNVVGQVTDAGKNSVKISVVRIVSEQGDARGWFEKSLDHQVHDNYRDCDWDDDMTDVGDEIGVHGESMDLSAVHEGDLVELVGKIRVSYTKCGKYSETTERPVYDQLIELPR